MNFEDLGIQALKKAGLRVTKQRVAILKCFSEHKSPLSATDIHKYFENNSTEVDKVSVYRVLETLLSLKLIHSVSPNGAYLACTHFNCDTSQHIITRCESCGETKESGIPKEIIAPLIQYLNKNLKFKPDSHLLHVQGKCSKC